MTERTSMQSMAGTQVETRSVNIKILPPITHPSELSQSITAEASTATATLPPGLTATRITTFGSKTSGSSTLSKSSFTSSDPFPSASSTGTSTATAAGGALGIAIVVIIIVSVLTCVGACVWKCCIVKGRKDKATGQQVLPQSYGRSQGPRQQYYTPSTRYGHTQDLPRSETYGHSRNDVQLHNIDPDRPGNVRHQVGQSRSNTPISSNVQRNQRTERCPENDLQQPIVSPRKGYFYNNRTHDEQETRRGPHYDSH